MQVHGGMGFIEETGAAQYLRDVRVTAIYEGTNGIQAMDLVGRKLMDGGEAAFRLMDEIEARGRSRPRHAARPRRSRLAGRRNAARGDRVAGRAADMHDRFAGAVPYLRAFARCSAAISTCAPPGRGRNGRAAAWRGSTSPACCRTCAALLAAGAAGAPASTPLIARGSRRLMDGAAAPASATRGETPPAEAQATEVAPGILWMRLPLPMALDHVNVYALDDGDGWTVVDTGFDTAAPARLWAGASGRPAGRAAGPAR